MYPDIEERVVSMVEVYEVVGQTLIQSMDLGALGLIRTLNRDIGLGAVVLGSSLQPFLAGTSPVRALCLLPEQLTEATRSEIRRIGLACYVRTGDDPGSLERLSAWDVDGIITVRPSRDPTTRGRN